MDIGGTESKADNRQDTGEPVLLPFRMSSFVLSNLIVTGGMLTPNLTVRSTRKGGGSES
jgi:hypothetical protein